MASILPDFEYDIFISYRQNDNKYDGWVTEFVDNLQKELDATLKNPVSIYFDENPHDGLQDTHVVDESLKKKLKCLIFIPIISQTYCDESSFAWQHEFLAFNERATSDHLGINITLSNGNVASRVLPVQIHELETEDQTLLESIIGPLRSIKFIYRNAGVNRPLRMKDADLADNRNKTNYRNQINKVANALKALGSGIMGKSEGEPVKPKTKAPPIPEAESKSSNRSVYLGLVAILLVVIGYFGYQKYFTTPVDDVAVSLSLEKTIAVLPFANTKPDSDTDFLGFAIANQIIGDLDYNKEVIVRPASSIRKYDQKVFDAINVADDLKVNYVLTGTYLMQANIIRLNIELLEASSNIMIWRDKIEVDYNNAFELQDIVAKKVVSGLQIKFTPVELSRIGKDIPNDPLAYEYYLRGVSYPISGEGTALAIEMLNQSTKIDSNFAPAYSHLGYRTQMLAQFDLRGPILTKEAENFYLKALSLNDDLLSAQGDLATLFVETGRIEQAITVARNMVKISPNNAVAHFSLSYIYRYGGMLTEAIEELEIAVKLDPNNPRSRRLGLTYLIMGYYKKASEIFDMDKGSAYSLGWEADMLLRQEKNEQAKIIYERIISLPKENMWVRVAKFHHALMENNIKLSREIMNELEDANISDGEAWYFWASKYAMIGDDTGSLRCFKRAVNGGYYNYHFMENDFFMKSMRNDPEFQKLLAQAKAKHEAFKRKYF